MEPKQLSKRADQKSGEPFTKQDFTADNTALPVAVRAKLAARAWMPKQATPEEIHNRFGYKPRKKRLKKRRKLAAEEK